MANGAYMLIRGTEATRRRKRSKELHELEQLPGIVDAEPVSGAYDYVARVEERMPLTEALQKVMGKGWVHSVHVLSVGIPIEEIVDPEKTRERRRARRREVGARGWSSLPPASASAPP